MYSYTPGFRVALRTAIGAVIILSIAAFAYSDEHNHASKGPHGGAIVELGDEELHAEILHNDESSAVTVYLLDSEVKRYMTVSTQEIAINVKHGGKGLQFRLKAKPQQSDREGRTSRFETKSPQLIEMLDDHDAVAQLSLKVGKKSYVGRITHNHDHEHGDGHSHQH